MTNQTSLLEMVLHKNFGITATTYKVLPGVAARIFGLYNRHGAQVGTATVNKAVQTSYGEAVRSIHNHDLHRKQGTDSVSIRIVGIVDSIEDRVYPYTIATNEKVPPTLGDMFLRGLFASGKSSNASPFQQPWG